MDQLIPSLPSSIHPSPTPARHLNNFRKLLRSAMTGGQPRLGLLPLFLPSGGFPQHKKDVEIFKVRHMRKLPKRGVLDTNRYKYCSNTNYYLSLYNGSSSIIMIIRSVTYQHLFFCFSPPPPPLSWLVSGCTRTEEETTRIRHCVTSSGCA